METTEKIVDSYCKYVREWFTMSNIKCPGQYEIDLLAIDPVSGKRYHIECGISISGSFSKLTSKKFSHQHLKIRTEQASQRRTVGYFIQRKFGPQEVISKLKGYGFKDSNYTKVIVTWGWTDGAKVEALKNGIELWDFRNIMYEIYREFAGTKTYFIDDTMRTIQLFTKAAKQKEVFGFKPPK